MLGLLTSLSILENPFYRDVLMTFLPYAGRIGRPCDSLRTHSCDNGFRGLVAKIAKLIIHKYMSTSPFPFDGPILKLETTTAYHPFPCLSP